MTLRLLIAAVILATTNQAQPLRLVSTSPSITETLFALGLGEQVVGVSTYCHYPSVVLSLPKIGTYSKPDPEKIALLRPDLVVIHHSATTLAGRLSALGIHYAEVNIGSLAQVYSMITDMGAATGVPHRAEQLNGQIRSRLEGFRTQVSNQVKPTVLILVGRDLGLLSNLVAVGPTPYLGELLEIAGGRNVLSDVPLAYPHISLETVVRLNPDVILDASSMGNVNTDKKQQEARLQEPWLSHRELNATRHGLVFGLSSESLVTPGPRVVEAVGLIQTRIHSKGQAR